MKFTINVVILSLLMSCSGKSDHKSVNIKPSKTTELNQITSDTTNVSFPIQIANDKGSVELIGIRVFKNNQLSDSNFTISLNDIADASIVKYVLIPKL